MGKFHPKALKVWVRYRRTLGDSNAQIAEGVRFLSLDPDGSRLVDSRLESSGSYRHNYYGSLWEQRYWYSGMVFTPRGAYPVDYET